MEGENTKESTAVITGLGLTCVALFLIVSLYTHSQYDLMDYHAAQSREISAAPARGRFATGGLRWLRHNDDAPCDC